MKIIPINTDRGGQLAKTVLAGYYKYGCATLLGKNFGTTGTIILEIYEKESIDEQKPAEELWESGLAGSVRDDTRHGL